MYSRSKDKWDGVILLVLDQSKVKLPPVAQNILLETMKHKDARAFKRWNSMLEDEQMKRLMDKYPGYGTNVATASNEQQTAQPSRCTRDRETTIRSGLVKSPELRKYSTTIPKRKRKRKQKWKEFQRTRYHLAKDRMES